QRLGKKPCQLWPARDWTYGVAWTSLGSIHSPDQQPALYLLAKRAGLHQPANCGMFHPRDCLAAIEWCRSNYVTSHWFRAWRSAISNGIEGTRSRRTLLHIRSRLVAG